MTVVGASDIDACPYCGTTTGVRPIANNPPTVRAWSCTACGTDWAVSVVNPYPYLDRLIEAVELTAARSVLRRLIALADEAPRLTEVEMRARLMDLVGAARPGQQPARCCRG